jgi:hypothetical protein
MANVVVVVVVKLTSRCSNDLVLRKRLLID